VFARLKLWFGHLPVRVAAWVLFWTFLGFLDGAQAFAGLQM
jgi:hypothetical protein